MKDTMMSIAKVAPSTRKLPEDWLEFYEELLTKMEGRGKPPFRLLQMDGDGAMLRVLEARLPDTKIMAMSRTPKTTFGQQNPRVGLVEVTATNTEKVGAALQGYSFDLIIDSSGLPLVYTLSIFRFLFRFNLMRNGYYVVENFAAGTNVLGQFETMWPAPQDASGTNLSLAYRMVAELAVCQRSAPATSSTRAVGNSKIRELVVRENIFAVNKR